MGNPWCTPLGWKTCGSIPHACISRHPLVLGIPLNTSLWTRKTLIGYQDHFMRLVTCQVFHLEVWVPIWDLRKRYCSELFRMLVYIRVEDHPHILRSCQGRSEAASHYTHSLSLYVMCPPTRCDGADELTPPSSVVWWMLYRRGFGPFIWKIHKHAA